jgi:pentatricopeptide repeat protein
MGKEIFHRMTRNPCLMDLLGRAGHLEEAHALIMNMEVAPISDKWAALQSAG